MIHTRICDLLGIDHPIVLGGMGSASTATLVAAVSNAGSLGTLGTSAFNAATLKNEIAAVVGEVMLGYPNMIVTKPVHLFHLAEHLMVKLGHRAVEIRHVGRQIVRSKLGHAHGLINLQEISLII